MNVRLTTTIRFACLASVLALFVATAAAQPGAAAAEVEQYRVGPGDELSISIHSGLASEDPVELTLPVAGDGTIDVIQAGRIRVAGLSTSEIQARIRGGLRQAGYMTNPLVSVNVTKYLSQCVNVVGAVTKQGRFCLQGPTRLLDILSMAEGVVGADAGRTIIINRLGASEPIRVDRNDLVSADQARAQAANVRVLAGDNVHVPLKARFCISGPLEKAGCYTYDEGASLQQAIALAGGMKEGADATNITMRRTNGIELKVNLEDLEARGTPAPLLEPDDAITVGTVQLLRFCVNGQVTEPDCSDYQRGLTIEGALSKVGGLVQNKADRQHILVRRIVDGHMKEIVVNLDDPSEKGASFLIEANDQIVVQAQDCLVTVGGGVRTPGQIEYKTGMSLTDALQAAGGTQDAVTGFALGKLSEVTLKRGDQIQVVDVRAIMKGKAPDPPVQCGDRIFVPSRALGGPK